MATEKRLIDANALKDKFLYLRKMWSETEIVLTINDAKTVDAVELVRCKDCKWMVEFTGKDSGKPCGYGRCDNPIGLMGIVYNESYCSYPEKENP